MRDGWSLPAIALVTAIVIFSAIVGFAWLPHEQPGARFSGLWDAICSAAGLRVSAPASVVVQPDFPGTRVAVTQQMFVRPDGVSVGRGATLALRCTMCHGAQGVSDADTPNLAGQYPDAIYKQLVDFKTGARTSAVMAPLVACHGELNNKPGAPWLEGEPERYLRTQLESFVAGPRRNDIDGQMRNVARAMTPEEIAAASRWYAGAIR